MLFRSSALAGIAVSVAQIRPILEFAEPILKAEPEITVGKQPLDHVAGHMHLLMAARAKRTPTAHRF